MHKRSVIEIILFADVLFADLAIVILGLDGSLSILHLHPSL